MNYKFAIKYKKMSQFLSNISLFIMLMVFSYSNFSHAQTHENAKTLGLFKTFESGDVCYTIGDKYAGEFILGDEIPKQEYLEHFAIRKVNNPKDYYYIISEKGHDLIQLIPQKQNSGVQNIETIKEIRVIANKFKTPSGITVDSEIEDLIRTYPSCHLSYSQNSNLISVESDESSAKFIIPKSDYKGKLTKDISMAKLDISKFKPHSKIVEVRLL